MAAPSKPALSGGDAVSERGVGGAPIGEGRGGAREEAKEERGTEALTAFIPDATRAIWAREEPRTKDGASSRVSAPGAGGPVAPVARELRPRLRPRLPTSFPILGRPPISAMPRRMSCWRRRWIASPLRVTALTHAVEAGDGTHSATAVAAGSQARAEACDR